MHTNTKNMLECSLVWMHFGYVGLPFGGVSDKLSEKFKAEQVIFSIFGYRAGHG